ncbi:MAG TPA: selenocysteine-specific translation elongation factor [Candidatus Krumholzibacteria bacterium]|nr:selenocysteine-specific translation elongation factor [Candidatus Krumholzibacteria bacterium]
MRKNRHIIVGTAGHVDHGKTELVRVLTGVNTDRLREEQERGISIELGFAPMILPSGECVGLVDVPGHERFIKAMVAGAAGMDLGMLIVAADESIMPQTREHLDIMQLLGLRGGVVVVTKCDLVDEETSAIVDAEIEDLVRGTFLANARIVHTSARTRRGLDELLAALDELTATLPARPTADTFRLPVDRVFALSGVGLVVTGTAWSGTVHEGDTLEVLPPALPARVRGLQVHGEKRDTAYAGERIAINLHGLKSSDVDRGMLVASAGMLQASYMVDAQIFLLPTFARPLANRTRVRVHHGAAEVLGRVVLLDRDALEPGQSAPAQLRLEQPLACERGDAMVLRFYSPMRTLGGARVLDPAPAKHKRFRAAVLEEMQLKESGDAPGLLFEAIRRAGNSGLGRDELLRQRLVPSTAVDDLVAGLLREAKITGIGDAYYAGEVLASTRSEIERLAAAFQKANPLSWGIGRAELQERLGQQGGRGRFNELLDHLASHQGQGPAIHLRPDAVRVGSADRELSTPDRHGIEKLEATLRGAGVSPPTVAELQKEAAFGTRLAAYVGVLEERGAIVKVTESLLYHREAFDAISAKLVAFLRTHDVMTMVDFKDMAGISRKYAVPLLEYFDRKGVTTRAGDVRKPGPLVHQERSSA